MLGGIQKIESGNHEPTVTLIGALGAMAIIAMMILVPMVIT